jgi:hypothetical protein
MATGESLTATPGIRVYRDDCSVFVSDYPSFAPGQRLVPYHRTAVFRDGLDIKVVGLSDPKVG